MNFDDILSDLQRSDHGLADGSGDGGVIAGLGIDVFHTEPFPPLETDPILSHPRVVCTPHVAGVTEVSYRSMADLVADNVLRLFAGKERPVGIVNADLIV